MKLFLRLFQRNFAYLAIARPDATRNLPIAVDKKRVSMGRVSQKMITFAADMPTERISAHEFEALFRELHSRLYYYALGFVEDGEASKDIVNEVFMGAWHNRENIERAKLTGYLYTGVRNKCISHNSQQKREATPPNFEWERLEDAGDDEWRRREERIAEMERVIATLPERTRYILEECYYQRHTYREVADELGITTDGIKKHIVKAMAKLREHFNIDKHKK